LFYFAREAAGAAGTRLSLRPCFSRDDVRAQLGRIAPRECEFMSDEYARHIFNRHHLRSIVITRAFARPVGSQ
jgi:hypothetical protein